MFLSPPAPPPRKSITQSQTLISLRKQKKKNFNDISTEISLFMQTHTQMWCIDTYVTRAEKHSRKEKRKQKVLARAFIFVYRGGP